MIALVQGVTELFPVSSLGHSVLVPAWIGGSWHTLVAQSSDANSSSSFYLSFIVALHCATALALLWFFRADWIRIVTGLLRSLRRSLRDREFSALGSDKRLAWLIVLATIPVGLVGVTLEHTFRTVLAKPVAASAFLFINGLILLAGEGARRRAERRLLSARPPRGEARRPPLVEAAGPPEGSPEFVASGARTVEELAAAYASDVRIARIGYRDSIYVGSFQITALLAASAAPA